MNKKAQMRILESVAVLVIFFILLVIASTIYFKIQNSRMDKERLVFENAETMRTLIKLQSLPELDCSFASAHTINCFDKYKLIAFSDLIKKDAAKEFYYPIFGEATISVNISFPVKENFLIYDSKPSKFRSMIKQMMPVLVYDAVSGKYLFSQSEVSKYVQ